MSFKKLHPLLKEALEQQGYNSLIGFQKNILPVLKGGADAYVIGPEGSGRTTALLINIIHKLKAEAFEDSPRAVIVVKDKQATLEMEQQLKPLVYNTDLRIYRLYDEYDIEKQKEEIYYGTDILIATPARLSKLYFLNGVHLGQIKIFALDDADYLARNNAYNHILRLTESIEKCQFIIIADKLNSKISNYQSSFMTNAQLIKKE